jgi:hypothetical protein
MITKKLNKKAELSNLMKIILWTLFFIIILGGVYFLLNKLMP